MIEAHGTAVVRLPDFLTNLPYRHIFSGGPVDRHCRNGRSAVAQAGTELRFVPIKIGFALPNFTSLSPQAAGSQEKEKSISRYFIF
jgi:hypothetical protein